MRNRSTAVRSLALTNSPQGMKRTLTLFPYQATQQPLSTLTRVEKAELLQSIVCDLGDVFPGIEMAPGVAGGEPCIVRARIPIWVLERARRLGVSEADLFQYVRLKPPPLGG